MQQSQQGNERSDASEPAEQAALECSTATKEKRLDKPQPAEEGAFECPPKPAEKELRE